MMVCNSRPEINIKETVGIINYYYLGTSGNLFQG